MDLLDSSDSLARFLADTTLDNEGKRRALDELLSGHVHPVLLHFLMLLIEQNELRRFKNICHRFFDEVSAARRQVSGEITTACPLTPEQVKEVEREVGRILDRDVSLRVREDGGLLGGMRVKIGDFIIDGTVDARLDEMRRDLLTHE
jgi:F-type H+-transporting ATPase subunit delta